MSTLAALPLPMAVKALTSDQEVRWCPGCGDYSILAQTRKALGGLPIPREKLVFVSGIGCSSRFPYYMNTYGFHTIHGRAPAIATGLKIANPELQIWVITGDGDGLSIGGNHLMHACRRNVELKIVLFNNEIYGLTKGQYSPTSRAGTKTKSSPSGSVEQPLHPLTMALASGATFLARSTDVDVKHLAEVLNRASAHQGAAFIEVYQNCKIFNDGVFDYATDKAVRADNLLYLEHGKPMIFGAKSDRGIRFNTSTMALEVVPVNDETRGQILVHDEKATEPNLAYMLSRMTGPEFPEVMGILRITQKPTFNGQVEEGNSRVTQRMGRGDLAKLFRNDDTWQVV